MPEVVPKSLSIDLSQSIVFSLVFITVAVLVGLGKVDAEKLQYLLLVLVPSPLTVKKDPS